MSSSEQPIGLFDSGIGGLTVLKTLRQRLPKESFVYLGDTARLPYGSKSAETIEKYVRQNIAFLMKYDVKAIVVACNSASSVFINKNIEFDVPVYNVIEPGARQALAVSESKRIGVFGTRATVSGQAYVKAIKNLDPSAQVWQQPCPLLVPLVEEGWEEDPLTNLVVYRYAGPLVQSQKVDTLILGCTHYPVLRGSFEKVAGPGVHLVDSAEAISQLIQQDLDRGRLPRSKTTEGTLEIYVTDYSPMFAEVATRLMAPLHLPPMITVDLNDPLAGRGRTA